MTEVFIGIDGGGTHARAVVLDGAARELARLAGPPGLLDPLDPAGGVENLARLARDALHQAALSPPAAGLCCGLAGAVRAAERDAVQSALARSGIARAVVITGDAEAAMADAFGDGPGILLIAGTGSIARARGDKGRLVRVGGWGTLLGDEGSGYAIGLAALRAVLRAEDGRDPPTALTAAVLRRTASASPFDLIRYAAAASKRDIAALAPIVLEAADAHDTAAARIRTDAVTHLTELAVSAARQTAPASAAVALSGGLLQPGGPLRDSVADRIRQRLPDTSLIPHSIDAARGAARLAMAG